MQQPRPPVSIPSTLEGTATSAPTTLPASTPAQPGASATAATSIPAPAQAEVTSAVTRAPGGQPAVASKEKPLLLNERPLILQDLIDQVCFEIHVFRKFLKFNALFSFFAGETRTSEARRLNCCSCSCHHSSCQAHSGTGPRTCPHHARSRAASAGACGQWRCSGRAAGSAALEFTATDGDARSASAPYSPARHAEVQP